ncbi:hypothetical protein K227x_10750 [Rubripirellula lacrimiformis]|uniref:Uncharacterized protein n=1 Tax=Rubripirellula lacrimiformis TaxID=1930273 RepID=A0A517N6D7_9BACT|nr:hypothetical protein [Rubripirellula lacrimiformis]QDT02697.1 hypothetical protein K227x_10750 [Rubripirellula lacrimiformis]
MTGSESITSSARIQRQRNERTRDDWDQFAQHRQQVTHLLTQVAGQRRAANEVAGYQDADKKDSGRVDSDSLLILGVGNGNDIDLPTLDAAYWSITVADIDPDAITRCMSRLPHPLAQRITVKCPVDLSGALHSLPRDAATASDADWDRFIQIAANPKVDSIEPCDVVVSACLVSQLIDTVVGRVPASHPRFADAVLAIRDGHLNLLARLTRPGGTIVLITDVVSSDTLPDLARVSPAQLPMLVRTAIEARNFFTGLNAAVLMHRLSPAVCDRIAGSQFHGPWRWQMGHRVYAVIALIAQTVSAAPSDSGPENDGVDADGGPH